MVTLQLEINNIDKQIICKLHKIDREGKKSLAQILFPILDKLLFFQPGYLSQNSEMLLYVFQAVNTNHVLI